MQNQIVKSAIKQHNSVQLNYFGEDVKKTMIPVDSYYVHRHIEEFIDFTGIKLTDRILEVGCGMGKFTLPLLKRRFKITGLDLSSFLLHKLLQYNNNRFSVDLIASDILEIPDEYGETFDHVIGFFTLHHFHNLHVYYQAMSRIVKPGGSIVFIEPNAYNPLYYFQILFSSTMSWKGDKGVARMRRKNFLQAALFARLENLSIKKYGFFPPFIVNTPLGRKMESIIEHLKIFKKFSAFQIVKVIKPK